MCMQDYQIARHVKYRAVSYTTGGAAPFQIGVYDEGRYGYIVAPPDNFSIVFWPERNPTAILRFAQIASTDSNPFVMDILRYGQLVWEPLQIFPQGPHDGTVWELFLDTSNESLKKYIRVGT